MANRKRLVIALGGNAIIKNYQRGTVYEQFANTRESLKDVPRFIRDGYELVVTHGNGPQVGNILIRVEKSMAVAYELPLGVCVAESQGEMGYMIAQTLKNFLILEKIDKEVAALVTQVIVDPDHPATFDPVKPIGPYLTPSQLRSLNRRKVPVRDDAGKGMRRIVPSPIPLRVVEGPVIRKLLESGILVVAAGGGGMPVYEDHRGCFEGVDAVVDKDLASSLLATEKVSLNFNKPDQVDLDRMTVSEARKYHDEGHFPPGNMGPKVDAALRFLEAGGRRVVITSAEKLRPAFREETGTIITPG